MTVFWSSLGLAGAAAAVIAVIGFAAVRSGDDGERVVANPPDDLKGFVALTTGGEIRRYDPTGRDRGLITDTGWTPEGNVVQPEIAVSPDGTVYFSRHAGATECGPGTASTALWPSEIVAVPVEGGEPEVVTEVGWAPAVSPDGSQLAFISNPSGQRCESGVSQEVNEYRPTTVALLDLETGERSVPDITYPNPSGDSPFTYEPEGPLAWAPDGDELATNASCTAPGECEGAYTTVVPTAGGEARYLYQWGEGNGGPALAFADDTSVFVNSSELGSDGWIGLMGGDASDPTAATALAVPEFISLPSATQPLSLSTLAGENAPGILATLGNSGDVATTTRAVVFADGPESDPTELTDNIVSAAWIPGTTADDLVSSTVPSGFVALTSDGELRRYDTSGRDVGVIAATGWQVGANISPPTFSVAQDGTVFFSRPATDRACPRSDQLGFEIVSVPLEGGDPEVVSPVGTSPAVSPDGRELAYLTTPTGDQCDRDALVLEVRQGSDTRRVELPSGGDIPGRPTPITAPIVWSPDQSSIALNMLYGDLEGWDTVVVDVHYGGGQAVYAWGEGSGGSAVAFVDDTMLLVDASIAQGPGGIDAWIGQADTDVTEAVTRDALAIPQLIGLPDLNRLLSLSTLPGESAPGILAVGVLDSAPDDGQVLLYDEGQESDQQVLATGVQAAVWIPGTTYNDLPADPAPTR